MAGGASVIVPAAGAGLRMGGDVRKQFRTLGDAPVLVQTLRAFESHPDVAALTVVVPMGEVEPVRALLDEYALAKLTAVVAGGATRQDSVRKGIEAVVAYGADSDTLVLVHDGVRPFISTDAIARVVDAAKTHGAASLALAVADTLRREAEREHRAEAADAASSDGVRVFGETVPREGLWRMQTPQAFRLGLLANAHTVARRDGFVGTDDVALVQRLGQPVRIVPGSAFNVKLTRPSDWAFAEAMWVVWEERRPHRT